MVLLIPQDFELVVEEALGVFERDVLRCTAPRGHMLGILNGKGKLTLETGMAHSVAACKLHCLVDGEFIIHADKAVDHGNLLVSNRDRCA